MSPKPEAHTQPGEVPHITAKEMDELLKQKGIVIVDFFADWCGPCVKLGELLKKDFLPRIKDMPNVKLVKVNTDDNQDVAVRLGIRGIPAVFVFKDGKVAEHEETTTSGKKEIVKSFVGYNPAMPQKLLDFIKTLK